MNQINSLDYYNQNAELYFEQTHDISRYRNSIGRQIRTFLSFLPSDAFILDFGCGSGRDSKYFLEHGYLVDSVDGSAAMCRIASKFTGRPVRQMLFSELEANQVYHGIWASASILHAAPDSLAEVFTKMLRALRPQGVIYTSFKLGDGIHIKEGKSYLRTTPENLTKLLDSLPEKATIIRFDSNISPKRSGPGENCWGNYFIQKA